MTLAGQALSPSQTEGGPQKHATLPGTNSINWPGKRGPRALQSEPADVYTGAFTASVTSHEVSPIVKI